MSVFRFKFVKTTFTFSLIVAITLLIRTPEILEFKTPDEYFLAKETHAILAVFFHNSTAVSWRREQILDIIQSMQQLENLRRHEPIYSIIDLSTNSFLKEHYDFTQNDNMILLISNQLVIKDNYPLIWNQQTQSTIKFEVHSFLNFHLEKQLKNLPELEDVVHLSEMENSCIFLGKNGTNFEVFKKTGKRFLDLNFVYSFKEEWKYGLFQYYEIDHYPEIDTVLFIRANKNVNEFDPKVIVYEKEDFKLEDFSYFVEFSNYPKIRGPIYFSEIFLKVFQKEQILVLFCKSLKQPLFELERTFRNSVRFLPRVLIYSVVDLSDDVSAGFSSLLIHANSFLSEGLFYIIHNDAGIIKTESFHLYVESEVEIVQKVTDFISRNRRLLPYFKFAKNEKVKTWNSEIKVDISDLSKIEQETDSLEDL